MHRIYVRLRLDERNALVKYSKREKRDPRQQAALLIRQGLERLGLLPSSLTGELHPTNIRTEEESFNVNNQ